MSYAKDYIFFVLLTTGFLIEVYVSPTRFETLDLDKVKLIQSGSYPNLLFWNNKNVEKCCGTK